MTKVKVYTRDINSENYPFGLAKAVHFSYEDKGANIALNRNYGILFALGEISQNNTIIPLGIDNPCIYRKPDGFIGICGRIALFACAVRMRDVAQSFVARHAFFK